MTKQEVLNGIQSMIKCFKGLPLYIREENKPLLGFLKQQYKYIQLTNKVCRYSRFASPTYLFAFNKDNEFNSIKLYFDTMGENINNIIAFKTISVLDSKNNKYIQINPGNITNI